MHPGHCTGDWVEVRSKDKIRKTLDKNGQLEGMPFMPEMFAAAASVFASTSEPTRPVTPPVGMEAVH